jgi:hypothetical protein
VNLKAPVQEAPEEEFEPEFLEELDSDNFWIVFNHYMKHRSVKRAFKTLMIRGKKYYVLPSGQKISAKNFQKGLEQTSMLEEYEKMKREE